MSRTSYLVVHLCVVFLFLKASAGLPRCSTPDEEHLGKLMQSVRGLALAFMQMTTMHWFMCAVTAMEAVMQWPKLVTVFGAAMALVSVSRCACSVITGPEQSEKACTSLAVPNSGCHAACFFLPRSPAISKPALALLCVCTVAGQWAHKHHAMPARAAIPSPSSCILICHHALAL